MSEKELHEVMLMLFFWALHSAKSRDEGVFLALALPILYEYKAVVYLN